MMLAMVIVHWPGKDVPACVDHAAKLQKLAEVMGFALSMDVVPWDDEDLVCTNCENEARKPAGRAPGVSAE